VAARSNPTKPNDVFINCPFDDGFAAGFRALVFAVVACGFTVRCAREDDDGTEQRIDKLYRIIEESRFGIHDLSYVKLDPSSKLPRFNMPFELGLFLAAKRYGSPEQHEKKCLVHDKEEHRFRLFISDLNGIDVTPHNDDPRQMVSNVRKFLFTATRRTTIPDRAKVLGSYDKFLKWLPRFLKQQQTSITHLSFPDYEIAVIEWVKQDKQLKG
jgi:hypothetical protein